MNASQIYRPLFGLLLASSLVANTALAAPDDDNNIYRWQAPPAAVQLNADNTVIPTGSGALFIPTLTGVEKEPQVLVVDGDAVRTVAVGRRVIVPPGRYVVVVGSSPPRLSEGVPVEVAVGKTTVVPVKWGALRVEVVDSQLRKREASFDLIEVSSGRKITTPGVLDPEDDSSTWLLSPGLYRIMEPGADRLTGPDFVTVHVPAGGAVQFRLFVDRTTGDFRGGGVVPANQTLPDKVEPSGWSSSLVFGADAAGTQTRNLTGVPDHTLATGTAFIDGRLRYSDRIHGLSLRGQVEEGAQYVETVQGRALPFIKSRDHLEGKAMYSLFLNEGLGIYARAGAETAAFKTWNVATDPVQIAIREQGGAVNYRTIGAGETWDVADPWRPTFLKEGAGARFRFVDTRPFRLSVRTGLGLRQNIVEGSLVANDNLNTPAIEFTRLESFNQRGFEASAEAGLRLSNAFSVSGELDAFWGFGDLSRPVIEFDGLANLRLTQVLSLNYLTSITSFPQITDALQVRHGGYLRASWSLL